MCGRLPRELRRFARRCSNVLRRVLLGFIPPVAACADLALEILVDHLDVDADVADMWLRRFTFGIVLPLFSWMLYTVLVEVNKAAPSFLPSGAQRTIQLDYGWLAMARATADCFGILLTLSGMFLHKLLSCYLAFWILWPWSAVALTSTWCIGIWMGEP